MKRKIIRYKYPNERNVYEIKRDEFKSLNSISKKYLIKFQQ